MKTILILSGVILLLGVFLYVFIRLFINEQKRVKALDKEIINLQANLSYLVKHAEEIDKIQKEKEKIKNQLQEAQTDEEIADIVANIINANNDRVQHAKD